MRGTYHRNAIYGTVSVEGLRAVASTGTYQELERGRIMVSGATNEVNTSRISRRLTTADHMKYMKLVKIIIQTVERAALSTYTWRLEAPQTTQDSQLPRRQDPKPVVISMTIC